MLVIQVHHPTRTRACYIKKLSQYYCFARLVTVGRHFCIIRKWQPSSIFMFCPFFSWKNLSWTQKSVLNKPSSDSQISKPQHGHPKRAELPNVNINTGAQSINTERAFLTMSLSKVNLSETRRLPNSDLPLKVWCCYGAHHNGNFCYWSRMFILLDIK